MAKITKAAAIAYTELDPTKMRNIMDSVPWEVDGASGTDTGALQLPTGTTAQRPGTPVDGMFRKNSETGALEVYDGVTSRWVAASIAWEENDTDLRPVTDEDGALGDSTHRVEDLWIRGKLLTPSRTFPFPACVAGDILYFVCPRACTITRVLTQRIGGTSAEVDVRNGSATVVDGNAPGTTLADATIITAGGEEQVAVNALIAVEIIAAVGDPHIVVSIEFDPA